MGVLMAKRKRRAFTREFKTEAVRLVLERGRSIPEVARELDLTESALRLWVHQAKVDQGQGKPGELTTVEREELHRLRREVKDLRIEREILKKGALLTFPWVINHALEAADKGHRGQAWRGQSAPPRSETRKPAV